MGEKDGYILALKISNNERQEIIDDLLKEDLIKHNVIEELRREIDRLNLKIDSLSIN